MNKKFLAVAIPAVLLAGNATHSRHTVVMPVQLKFMVNFAPT